jgi:hypothetical protein
MHNYETGAIYEAEGQPSLVITQGNALENGLHGPWVKWRFEWDTENECETASICWNFSTMLEMGHYARRLLTDAISTDN